jgi:membrane protein implicated in regulation of membrane protease activity
MPDWVVWLVLAALLAAGELLTLTLFLAPLALGAVAAAIVGAAGANLAIQIVVFLGVSLAVLVGLRPIAKRHLRTPAALRTGTAALPGTKGVVLERVDDLGGRVKIGGEVWSARSFFEGQVYEEGARVEVAKIEGATALVFE